MAHLDSRPSLMFRLTSVVFGMSIFFALFLGRLAYFIPQIALIITITLFVLGGLVYTLQINQPAISSRTPIDAGLLLFGIALVITSFTSIDPSRSWPATWVWISCIIFYYLAVVVLRSGLKAQTAVNYILTALTFFLVFAYQELFLFLWQINDAGLTLSQVNFPRINGINSSVNILGLMMSMGIQLAVIPALESRSERQNWKLIWAIAALIILLLTGSRGAILSLLAGFSIYGLILFTRQAFSWKQIGMIGVGLFVAAIAMVQLLLIIRPGAFDIQEATRGDLWISSIRAWRSNPWLGTGLDTEGTSNLIYIQLPLMFKAAHSLYFSLLATGIIGLLGALLVAFQAGVHIFKSVPNRLTPHGSASLCALGAFLVQNIFDTPDGWMLFLLFCIAAIFFEQTTSQDLNTGYLKRSIQIVSIVLVISTAASIASFNTRQNYNEGLAYFEEGNYEEAAIRFDEAIQHPLYGDSTALLASGLTYGLLASSHPQHTQTAIERFEALTAQEPGYETTHLNLGVLYASIGDCDSALKSLAIAKDQEPTYALYQLNYALVYEECTNQSADWEAVYSADRVWRGAPLWETVFPQQALQPISIEIFEDTDSKIQFTLGQGDVAEAQKLIEESTPYKYILLDYALIELVNGDQEEALNLMANQSFLNPGLTAAMWQQWIALGDAPQDDQLEFTRSFIQFHTTAGMGGGGASQYELQIFYKNGVPVDILPQATCFASTESLDLYFGILEEWHRQRGSEDQSLWIESFRAGADGRGLIPCIPPLES